MIVSRGLLHVNLNVAEAERSIGFYCNALGFEVVSDSSEIQDIGSGVEDVRQVILTVPNTGTLLALTQAKSLPLGAAGLNHLGLVVGSDMDVASVLERVEAHGGSVIRHGDRGTANLGEAFAYVRDPDGYAIEVATQAILYADFRESQPGVRA